MSRRLRPFPLSASPLTVLLGAGLSAIFAPWHSASSQEPEPAAPAQLTTHTSGLGMKFVALPDVAVLFAEHETRVSDWETFVKETKSPWSYKPHFEQGANHPVVGITLQDAKAFCNWLTEKDRQSQKINVAQSYRLPTNQEWDAAAGLVRGRKTNVSVEEKVADDRTYPWGLTWPPPPKAANFAEHEIPNYEDGFPFTAPVGQFTPTKDGLFDLAGNVWEWCWDQEIRAEQVGVLRGGSWAYFRAECLTSGYRYVVPSTLQMPTIGFRCVFEDKQRTAHILASVEAESLRLRTERRDQLMGKGEIKTEELDAMRKKLAGASGASDLPDPSKLTPAKGGAPFLNALGMEFVPLGDRILIGATEVRVQDYEAWLKVTGGSWDRKPSFLLGGNHPAAGLSWQEATAFCAWLTEKDRATGLLPAGASYRLPTDAEWSLAAGLKDEAGTDPAKRHGGNTTHFPWSAEGAFPPPSSTVNLDASKIAGYNDNYAYTAPVKMELAGETGVYGLGGNVAEWCQDEWPGAAEEHVIRGGSWLMSDKTALLTSSRVHAGKAFTRPDLGFRCVIELAAP